MGWLQNSDASDSSGDDEFGDRSKRRKRDSRSSATPGKVGLTVSPQYCARASRCDAFVLCASPHSTATVTSLASVCLQVAPAPEKIGMMTSDMVRIQRVDRDHVPQYPPHLPPGHPAMARPWPPHARFPPGAPHPYYGPPPSGYRGPPPPHMGAHPPPHSAAQGPMRPWPPHQPGAPMRPEGFRPGMPPMHGYPPFPPAPDGRPPGPHDPRMQRPPVGYMPPNGPHGDVMRGPPPHLQRPMYPGAPPHPYGYPHMNQPGAPVLRPMPPAVDPRAPAPGQPTSLAAPLSVGESQAEVGKTVESRACASPSSSATLTQSPRSSLASPGPPLSPSKSHAPAVGQLHSKCHSPVTYCSI